jgi:hypothetical protein
MRPVIDHKLPLRIRSKPLLIEALIYNNFIPSEHSTRASNYPHTGLARGGIAARESFRDRARKMSMCLWSSDINQSAQWTQPRLVWSQSTCLQRGREQPLFLHSFGREFKTN